jgi:hypothetical protein
MSELGQTMESVAAQAAVMCTQCLIDAVNEESAELSAKVGHLVVASAMRQRGRNWEAWYCQAFAEVMASVLVIALFTAELSKCREVAWTGTNPPATAVQISMN